MLKYCMLRPHGSSAALVPTPLFLSRVYSRDCNCCFNLIHTISSLPSHPSLYKLKIISVVSEENPLPQPGLRLIPKAFCTLAAASSCNREFFLFPPLSQLLLLLLPHATHNAHVARARHAVYNGLHELKPGRKKWLPIKESWKGRKRHFRH